MANEILKVNAIAIASIDTINNKTDAHIQAFNGLEFTGFIYDGLTWATGSTETHRGGHSGTGTVDAFIIIAGTL